MSTIAPFPGLVTRTPWNPPLTPFRWRLVAMGPIDVEFMVDAAGKQLFEDGGAAVWRKAVCKSEKRVCQ